MIDQANQVEGSLRDGLAVEVRLAERASLSKGDERNAVETALFERVARLRASGKPESASGLIALASEIAEPGEGRDASAWEAVAEGALLLGEIGRASALESHGRPTRRARRGRAGVGPPAQGRGRSCSRPRNIERPTPC